MRYCVKLYKLHLLYSIWFSSDAKNKSGDVFDPRTTDSIFYAMTLRNPTIVLQHSFTVFVLLFNFFSIRLSVYKKVDVVFLHIYYLNIYHCEKGYTNINTCTLV